MGSLCLHMPLGGVGKWQKMLGSLQLDPLHLVWAWVIHGKARGEAVSATDTKLLPGYTAGSIWRMRGQAQLG